jgi:hypothetical protein
LKLAIARSLAIEMSQLPAHAKPAKNCHMTTEATTEETQRIDLGDMALVRTADGLAIEHVKLAQPKPLDEVQLRNWLKRQLREVF